MSSSERTPDDLNRLSWGADDLGAISHLRHGDEHGQRDAAVRLAILGIDALQRVLAQVAFAPAVDRERRDLALEPVEVFVDPAGLALRVFENSGGWWDRC